jgi:hypothetical protein
MSGFEVHRASGFSWERNVLGSQVTRLRTDGAMLTIVEGRAGDVVPAHGYSRGSVTYIVRGAVEINGEILRAGDGGTYSPPGGYFAVKFLEDSTYVVARAHDDEITVPDIGERAAHHLDA